MQAPPQSTTASRTTSSFRRSQSVAEGPGLAHDAGNLLGALGLYCDLLEVPGVLQPQHSHYAREIRLLAQRSSVLIQRLLEEFPAHPIEDNHRPEVVTCDFTPLLRSLTAPDIELCVDVDSRLPGLTFAAEVLERILVNLTRNAAAALRRQRVRRSTDQQARIRIVLSGDATHLQLQVNDNGPGLPPALVRAFLTPGPLTQGATTGLGHRVVHELVQTTGGHLSIATRRGHGTSVTIDWRAHRLT